MNITSAKFIKGIVDADSALEANFPQIAFIGRSNVGKSSIINSLTKQKDLAKTSSFPGRTQQINLFLINNNTYLVDLPGYGYAKLSKESREDLQDLISWYLFDSGYVQKKVVMIVDAFIGPTASDIEMFEALTEHEKDIVIIANKVDKIKKSEYTKQLQKIKDTFNEYKVIAYSSVKGIGARELTEAILSK